MSTCFSSFMNCFSHIIVTICWQMTSFITSETYDIFQLFSLRTLWSPVIWFITNVTRTTVIRIFRKFWQWFFLFNNWLHNFLFIWEITMALSKHIFRISRSTIMIFRILIFWRIICFFIRNGFGQGNIRWRRSWINRWLNRIILSGRSIRVIKFEIRILSIYLSNHLLCYFSIFILVERMVSIVQISFDVFAFANHHSRFFFKGHAIKNFLLFLLFN